MSDMRQEPDPLRGPAGEPAADASAHAPRSGREFITAQYTDAGPPSYRTLDLNVPGSEDLAEIVVGGPAVPADLEHPRFIRREPPRQRRWFLPLFLFVATCVSTFWAGTTNGQALDVIGRPEWGGFMLAANWVNGLIYMSAVLGILFTHEMGHFLQAVRYGVPASLPYFIPMPFTPIGTMGAVIGMNGLQANRRELFDIGLSGPIAGLFVAIPVTCVGIMQAAIFPPDAPAGFYFQDPLLVKLLIQYLRPDVGVGQELSMNSWLMAGWVGLLITGLNMMPVSQLDGGHVTYALFGRGAHWIARIFLFLAVSAMVYTHTYAWMVMVFVVFVIGPDHPPTADDEAPLGPVRWALGLASLAIPIFCFPPLGLSAN